MRVRNIGPAGLVVVLACLLAVGTFVSAQDGGDLLDGGQNVMLEITLGAVGKSDTRNYRLVTRSGETMRMLVGWRTPIPMMTSDNPETAAVVKSHVYQNVGMTATLRTTTLLDGRLRVVGQIEISGATKSEETTAPEGMPTIGTYQQDLDVILEPGKALRVAEVPHPEGGQRFLEITASLMK
jgi:hypothetical protein